jgi:hypothetical protein
VIELFRVVLEAFLQGSPEEQACITKLRDAMAINGICTGSQLVFVCSFNNTLTKFSLVEESVRSLQQQILTGPFKALTLQIVIEGEKPHDVVKTTDLIYKTLRDCGILLKLP